MQQRMMGVVAIVQEGRLQIRDDGGIYHLFLLGANAAADTPQLAALQKRQARVRVTYKPAKDIVGKLISRIELA